MNDFRLVAGGFLLIGAFAASGCTAKCDASNCTGCCDASGTCQSPSANDCGLNGVSCSACVALQICQQGACVFEGGNAAGATSGNATGTAATATGSVSGGSSGSNSTGQGSSGQATSNGSSGGATTSVAASTATTNSTGNTTASSTGNATASSTGNATASSTSSTAGSSGTSGSCDCTTCTNSGLGCDVATCSCIVPSNTGTSSSGTVGASSSTIGTSNGGTSSSSTSSSSGGTTGGFCTVTQQSINDDGIGQPCTPDDTTLADGGTVPGHGNCSDQTEFCFVVFENDQDRCWNECTLTSPSCPGDSSCTDVGFGNGDGLCLALGYNSGTGCPTGEACESPSSPDPVDLCLCVPECSAATDCNGSNGTQFTCVSGACHCTDTSTDCSNGAVCDTASGACIFSCGSTSPCNADAGEGCCAQYGSTDYCDAAGTEPG